MRPSLTVRLNIFGSDRLHQQSETYLTLLVATGLGPIPTHTSTPVSTPSPVPTPTPTCNHNPASSSHRLAVVDDGPGLSESLQNDAAFEPFVSGSQSHGGTGVPKPKI